MNKIFICGISGAGKSSIIDSYIKINKNYQKKGDSRDLMSALGIEDYQHLRLFSEDKKKLVYEQILNNILSDDGKYLVDGHIINKNGGNYNKTIPESISRFDIIHIITDSYLIKQRILTDIKNKERRLALYDYKENISKQINDYQKRSLETYLQICRKLEKKPIIIDNSGSLEDSIFQLSEALKTKQS